MFFQHLQEIPLHVLENKVLQDSGSKSHSSGAKPPHHWL
jgi:hypothetical protein